MRMERQTEYVPRILISPDTFFFFFFFVSLPWNGKLFVVRRTRIC